MPFSAGLSWMLLNCYNSSMNIQVKTRFAPSPTGLMHFGNLRTALFNYLAAKQLQGTFLLRIEDTDNNRSEKQYRDAILADLQWLGIDWQEGPYYQSERQAIYNHYFEALEAAGGAYPCFCTEEHLAITRKVQLASHQAPRYPGTCRKLSAAEIQAKKAAGVPFTLRFEVSNQQQVNFTDLIKGEQHFETNHIGDFIIRRNDGSASFMFCNAIDDALLEVTHALRGDDHLTNTPRQILILQSLKLPIPSYGHFPTILGPDSRPLSKRNGSRSIQELRQEGYFPVAILNYLSRLGHHMPEMDLFDLQGLSQHFGLSHMSHSPAHYDAAQLQCWQKETMHKSPWKACWSHISPYVEQWVPPAHQEAFVGAIQSNLVMPTEAVTWAKAIFGELEYSQEVIKVFQDTGSEFFKVASKLVEDPSMTYQMLIQMLQERTGLKGKALFLPLRAALTGELHGPELAKVLTLIGLEKAKTRSLQAAKYATHL